MPKKVPESYFRALGNKDTNEAHYEYVKITYFHPVTREPQYMWGIWEYKDRRLASQVEYSDETQSKTEWEKIK